MGTECVVLQPERSSCPSRLHDTVSLALHPAQEQRAGSTDATQQLLPAVLEALPKGEQLPSWFAQRALRHRKVAPAAAAGGALHGCSTLHFKALTYNLLADQYVSELSSPERGREAPRTHGARGEARGGATSNAHGLLPHARTPRNALYAHLLQARHFRPSLYRDVPARAMGWPHRQALIVAELLHHAPDVACLQEVEHFAALQAALEPHGCAWLAFSRSLCAQPPGRASRAAALVLRMWLTRRYEGVWVGRGGRRRDGCATFWRRGRCASALRFTVTPQTGPGGPQS